MCNIRYVLSRMDFPSTLRPSLFMAGPLGMTDGPDLSFMCSWRDALTLPGSQPQNCKVRIEIGPLPWSHHHLSGKEVPAGATPAAHQPPCYLDGVFQQRLWLLFPRSLFPGFRHLLASVSVGILTSPGTQHEEIRHPHLRDCLWADPV